MGSVRAVLLTTLLAATGVAVPADEARACSCMPFTVESSYQNASDVFTYRVLAGVKLGWTQWYIGRVGFVAKGCLKKGQWAYVKTASNGAACGVTLSTGVTYLLNATADAAGGFSVPIMNIALCASQVPVSQLTKEDRKFLLSRYNCCGDTCACTDGSQPVNCFADPCEVADCPSGECTANYCGGCHAAFYDKYGNPVCTACKSDEDCTWGQMCSGGMCVTGCQSDEDCNEGFWCSPTQEPGVNHCQTYQSEGQSCGGFTPVWAQMKCEPGLICTDVPPLIADAPGTCRKPCDESSGCASDQYCASGGVCRDDGTCWAKGDCGMSGNDYPHIECVGYPVCNDDKTCGWVCGSQEKTTWHTTCGDPVCSRSSEPPAGVAECPDGLEQGDPCATEGKMCDAGLGCGAVLVCAAEDPKQNGCPISQRAAKTDISYLGDEDLEKVHRQLVDMRLATWRYKEEPAGAPARLGFIIEDDPTQPGVAPRGDRVDLYAYTSMAVAALKVQQQQIEALKQQVDTLTRALEQRGDDAGMCGEP